MDLFSTEGFRDFLVLLIEALLTWFLIKLNLSFGPVKAFFARKDRQEQGAEERSPGLADSMKRIEGKLDKVIRILTSP